MNKFGRFKEFYVSIKGLNKLLDLNAMIQSVLKIFFPAVTVYHLCQFHKDLPPGLPILTDGSCWSIRMTFPFSSMVVAGRGGRLSGPSLTGGLCSSIWMTFPFSSMVVAGRGRRFLPGPPIMVRSCVLSIGIPLFPPTMIPRVLSAGSTGKVPELSLMRKP